MRLCLYLTSLRNDSALPGADAAAALAEIVAGSEEQFAVLMNKKM